MAWQDGGRQSQVPQSHGERLARKWEVVRSHLGPWPKASHLASCRRCYPRTSQSKPQPQNLRVELQPQLVWIMVVV